MKRTKYFSGICNDSVIYRAICPNGICFLRIDGYSDSWINTGIVWTEEQLIELVDYLPVTKREATEQGKFPLPV